MLDPVVCVLDVSFCLEMIIVSLWGSIGVDLVLAWIRHLSSDTDDKTTSPTRPANTALPSSVRCLKSR